MFIRALVIAVMVSSLAPVTLAETVAKVYPVNDFTEFVSGGNTAIDISQGDTEYLRVEADAEVMKRIKVDQTGKRVTIWAKSNDGFLNWFGHSNDPVRVVLRVKQLEYLEVSGGARARLGDVHGEKLKLNVSGAGTVTFAALNAKLLKMELSGAANVRIDNVNSQAQEYHLSGASNVEIESASNSQELDVRASGASNFHGKKLTAKKADLGASGASHVEAAVTEILTAEASGASSVDYYGKPKAKTNASGASHVNARN